MTEATREALIRAGLTSPDGTVVHAATDDVIAAFQASAQPLYDVTLQQPEAGEPVAHRKMTREEYNALNLKGWHSVRHDYECAGVTEVAYGAAPPASADMREALKQTRRALIALQTRLKTEPAVQGRGWVSLSIVLNDAVDAADKALASARGTTSEGGASPSTRRLDDLGSVQDGRKMSTDGHRADAGNTSDGERRPVKRVTAGETAAISEGGVEGHALQREGSQKPFPPDDHEGAGLCEAGIKPSPSDTFAHGLEMAACWHEAEARHAKAIYSEMDRYSDDHEERTGWRSYKDKEDCHLYCATVIRKLSRPSDLTPPDREAVARPAAFLAWAVETFGPVAKLRSERLMRFVEEAIELAHADGMERRILTAIAQRVYARDPGEINKEIGQAQATLETYAENIGVSSDDLAEREWQRVQSIPREEWERRHAAKQALGIAITSGER
jgi:hypothetical protein